MSQWILKNLAPISFFSVVILAIVGINISSQSVNSRVDLLVSQAQQIHSDVDKYDSFLLFNYSLKTDDYKTFDQDVANFTAKLKASQAELSPVPNDEESTQLREDVKTLITFKVDAYSKIRFDLEPYLGILEQIKTIGQFKKAVLNPDKIAKEERLLNLTKINTAGQEILSFYKERRAGEPKIIEKVTLDTGFMTKAMESLQNNPEIEPKIMAEIMQNFEASPPDKAESWPSEQPFDYVVDQNSLGLNEMQRAKSYIEESTKALKMKYRS